MVNNIIVFIQSPACQGCVSHIILQINFFVLTLNQPFPVSGANYLRHFLVSGVFKCETFKCATPEAKLVDE